MIAESDMTLLAKGQRQELIYHFDSKSCEIKGFYETDFISGR